MAISPTLHSFLNQNKVTYDLIPHKHTGSSMETAEVAHVSGNLLAKAVILKDEERYIMVVVPSSEHVDLAELKRQVGHAFEMATENELGEVFTDCSLGAVPPIGAAWGVDVYLDECLLGQDEIFFEAGDHEDLVRVTGSEFERLMEGAKHGHFGHTI